MDSTARPLLPVLACLLLVGCLPNISPTVSFNTPENVVTSTITPFLPVAVTDTPEPVEATHTVEPTVPTPTDSLTVEPSPTPTVTPMPEELPLDPALWKEWPVLPIVTGYARVVYQVGLSLCNDPHAFSIFGDCQAEPGAFLGAYETDPALAAGLPAELQETLAWFAGSFDRDSPTIRGGTTSAALLWSAWHQNRYGCTVYETPLACELRLHKPSIVLIHVGTHYETRNDLYMRQIIDELLNAGVLPILTFKGDNREADESINLEYARLAVEYGLPLWNFWATLKSLENRGLYTRPEVAYQGDVYLTGQALVIHRLTGLQALDTVWRAVSAP